MDIGSLHLSDDILHYCISTFPLISILCAIPTLEEARRGLALWPRPLLIEPRDLFRVIDDYALTEASLRDGRWWTLLSHMFLHKDQEHLSNNIASLFVSGWEVSRSCGWQVLYATFLITGAAAGANSRGRLQQLEAQLAAKTTSVSDRLSSWMPEKISNFVDSGLKSTVPTIAKIGLEQSSRLGASGGVCGIMGYSLGLVLEKSVYAICAIRAGENGLQNSITTLLNSMFVLAHNGKFLSLEWNRARGEDGLTSTDHSGHLTGFAVGFGLLVLQRIVSRPLGRTDSRRHGHQHDRTFSTRGRWVDSDGNIRN